MVVRCMMEWYWSDKTMRHMGQVMGRRRDMGTRYKHVCSMGMVRNWRRVGKCFWMDRLIVVIGKIV